MTQMTQMTHYLGSLVPGMRREVRGGRLAGGSLQPADIVVRSQLSVVSCPFVHYPCRSDLSVVTLFHVSHRPAGSTSRRSRAMTGRAGSRTSGCRCGGNSGQQRRRSRQSMVRFTQGTKRFRWHSRPCRPKSQSIRQWWTFPDSPPVRYVSIRAGRMLRGIRVRERVRVRLRQ